MQCFMKKEDNSLIDVENVETIYVSFFAALASFLVSSTSVLLLSQSVQLHIPPWVHVHSFIMLALSVSTSLRSTSARRLKCLR